MENKDMKFGFFCPRVPVELSSDLIFQVSQAFKNFNAMEH